MSDISNARIRSLVCCLCLALITRPLFAQAPTGGPHDFDFEIGTWKTRLSRLVKPLTGSTEWVKYEGTTVVRKYGTVAPIWSSSKWTDPRVTSKR